MAVVAAELGMDRTFQGRRIDLQGDLVTAPENDSHGMLVTAKALLFLGTELASPAIEVSVWGLWQLAQTGALFSLVRSEAWTGERFSCSSAWHWRQIAEDLLLNCSGS